MAEIVVDGRKTILIFG